MSGPPEPPPVFHHTPVKPSRQPSRMAPRNGAANDPFIYTPSPQQQQQQQQQQQYNQNAAPASASVSSLPFRRPTNLITHNNGQMQQQQQQQQQQQPFEGGLRHRSGESISRSQSGGGAHADYNKGYGGTAPLPQHNGIPYSPYGGHPDAMVSSPSLYSQNYDDPSPRPHQNFNGAQQQHYYNDDPDGFKMTYDDRDDLAAHQQNNGFYARHGSDPSADPYGRPALPYAANDSELHLTQSVEMFGHDYETVHMNSAGHPPPPTGGHAYDYPPPMPPYQQGGGAYNNSNDGSYYKPEGGDGFVGGWAALAAPGTMIAQPLQQSNYMPSYDPAGYENVRQRLMRKRTVKKIALTNGNLVLDVPVPRSICKAQQADEFRTMRYSAVTCDPDNFTAERFTLRPFLMKRQTELAICMTCYNEDEQLLHRTLGAVIRNIGYLQSRTKSKTWGVNSWKKVTVFIVGDGRKKANERMLKMLSCYGIFQEGAMKDHVLDKEVTGHVFELTTQVIVDPNGGIKVSECPVQLVFCLKEKNAKKINSHRWFFNAFCNQLQPNVTILLDVGTMPTDRSLYYLWKAFDKNAKVAGACGEIAVDVGTMGWRLYNPLVAAQNFEYKMSNILDKPLESVFGFIGVLPGAFSAYRWRALKGRPLEAYFKGEALHNGTLEGGSFVNNLYLAEDRILCFELVVKANEPWILKYVKSAKATTDVPDGVAELIGQRRRWLNGSLFASMFALIHFGRIWTSGQSFLRKCVLQIQVIYNLVQMVFTWTSLANWYLASYFLMKSATSDPAHDPFAGQGKAVFDIVLNVYIALVVVVVVASLGSRPQGFRVMYVGCIVLFASLFALILYCVGWTLYVQLNQVGLFTTSGWTSKHILHLLVTSSNIRSIVVSIIATYVLYILSSLWMLDPWHMVTSFVQYMFLTPFFITVLAIYSLANLHDVSWGTKGADAASSDLGGASGAAGKNKDGTTVVEVKVPTSSADAEELWQHAQADLARKVTEQKQHRSKAVKQTDRQQNFRTQFLLLWLGSNAVLVIVFTSSFWESYTRNDLKLTTNPYLAVLFWSTAVLSAIRALGSLMYLVMRVFGH